MPIFNVNLTAEQMADLKARADKAGVPATEIVRRALWPGSPPIDTVAHPTDKGRKPVALTPSDSAAATRRATSPKPRAGVRGSGHLAIAAPPTSPEPPIRARAASAGAAPAVAPGVAAQQRRDEWLRKMNRNPK